MSPQTGKHFERCDQAPPASTAAVGSAGRSVNPTHCTLHGQRELFTTHKPNRVSYQKPFLFQGEGPRLLFPGGAPSSALRPRSRHYGQGSPGCPGPPSPIQVSATPPGTFKGRDRLHPGAPRNEAPRCRGTARAGHGAGYAAPSPGISPPPLPLPAGPAGRGCAPPAPAPPGAPRAPPPFPAQSAGRARPLHLSPRRTHSA